MVLSGYFAFDYNSNLCFGLRDNKKMTNEKITDITLVLDRSGSMSIIQAATQTGVRNFIKDQQDNAKEFGLKTAITYVQFDDQYEVVVNGVDIQSFEPPELFPRGWTALYDAIGKTIHHTGARLRDLQSRLRPGKVLFVIVTDGEENASKEFKFEAIQKMITHQRDVYSWEFLFLGANLDAQKLGTSFGIARGSTMSYSASPLGATAAFAAASDASMLYNNARSRSANFSSASYQAQATLGVSNDFSDASDMKVTTASTAQPNVVKTGSGNV